MRYTTDGLLPPPPANASSAEKIDFLHQQLDSMGVDAEILPNLFLLGGSGTERMQGGVLHNCLESVALQLIAKLHWPAEFFLGSLKEERCRRSYALA
jgi:hypothetical protein